MVDQFPPETGDTVISLKGVSKGFFAGGASFTVLNGVNLTVKKGETVAIVGASGIGKSTLLNIIGTLEKPDAGSLSYMGEDVFGYSDEKLARFRNETIGFVFQFHHLLPEFTALENVMMPLLIGGESKESARGPAEALLGRVGLQDRLNHRIVQLSGGEQQRVAIARAIVKKPAVLLADEPTGNLDGKNSRQVHELLDELNREFSMTMLVVTHNMELAAYMSRRITLFEGMLQNG